MSLRGRVLVFIGALVGIAIANLPSPWGLLIACAVYLLVVLPALKRGPEAVQLPDRDELLVRACADPGRYVERRVESTRLEPLHLWQARAIAAALDGLERR